MSSFLKYKEKVIDELSKTKSTIETVTEIEQIDNYIYLFNKSIAEETISIEEEKEQSRKLMNNVSSKIDKIPGW